MSRGGKRPGAGRPKGTTKKIRKILISVRVHPKVAKWVMSLAKVERASVVEDAIRRVMEERGENE